MDNLELVIKNYEILGNDITRQNSNHQLAVHYLQIAKWLRELRYLKEIEIPNLKEEIWKYKR